MSAADVIRDILNRSILVDDWPDDERLAYRETAGSTIRKFDAAEDIRVQKILDAVRAEQPEPKYGWGIRVDGYGTIAFNEDGQEEHARQFAARAPEYNLVRRTVGPWEDA